MGPRAESPQASVIFKAVMATELIGWSAAIILLVTIARQVYSQWRDRSHLQLAFKKLGIPGY
jgi:hypothetical protein